MKSREFMDLTDEEVTRIMTDIILKKFSSAKVDAIHRDYDREEISAIVTTGGWKVGENKTREFSDEITIWMPTGPDGGISAPFSPQTKEEIEALKTEYQKFLLAVLYRDFIKDNPYINGLPGNAVQNLTHTSLEDTKKEMAANTKALIKNEVAVIRNRGKVSVIGFVDSTNPLSVQLRWYLFTTKAGHYDENTYTDWEGTGKYISEDEWKQVSRDKSAKEICERLQIPYIEKTAQSINKTQNESEQISGEVKTYTDFTITERTEPFTLQEVLDFIDETDISKQDACELKARIVNLLQAEREQTASEYVQSYGEEVPELE